MNQQTTSTTNSNGESTVHDLFALSDEQILEIEPDALEPAASRSAPHPFSTGSANGSHQAEVGATLESPGADGGHASAGGVSPAPTHQSSEGAPHQSPAMGHDVPEPPPWLAAQMKDPWNGEQAKELWNGVQQAKSEAAAYRAAFANPEDARALKELYPGGVNEARAAAERARVLDDIDRAYFGITGKSAQEVSASRAQLAQQMLREDPAAFREMVFAGLRALEDAGKQTGATAVGATLASPGNHGAGAAGGGASPASAAPSDAGAPAAAGARANDASAHEAHMAAYAAFEKAANEDLERSVGASIERTLAQALPNATRMTASSGAGAQDTAPLQARLSQAIRQDVEAALKGDRQLGEQVAQILSGRRLDDEARGQVVRLIGERAQQLVPIAAKRVLNDWTQATLSAHRGKSARPAATARREVAPAASSPVHPQAAARERNTERSLSTNRARPVDYRKLSDEQILDL